MSHSRSPSIDDTVRSPLSIAVRRHCASGWARRGETATAMVAGTELKVFHHDGRVTAIEPDASAGGTGADPMAFPHDYHLGVIADFLDAVENDRAPAISGREALNVHRLIDALLEASATRGVVRMD